MGFLASFVQSLPVSAVSLHGGKPNRAERHTKRRPTTDYGSPEGLNLQVGEKTEVSSAGSGDTVSIRSNCPPTTKSRTSSDAAGGSLLLRRENRIITAWLRAPVESPQGITVFLSPARGNAIHGGWLLSAQPDGRRRQGDTVDRTLGSASFVEGMKLEETLEAFESEAWIWASSRQGKPTKLHY
ncbi:hypothetical protein L596_014531 [Steinernema carpocapsae]|uniref:Uncharacterized protein n=1 Tax=Steinernema carpocapsae TaxID=34508 RepID=A0A4U5ND98_STECR|nr:hypothetical protein L596_014531 [Steinernema carpocapsae]